MTNPVMLTARIGRRDAEPIQVKSVIPCCREKPLASSERPVPQTDTGGQVENTEAIG